WRRGGGADPGGGLSRKNRGGGAARGSPTSRGGGCAAWKARPTRVGALSTPLAPPLQPHQLAHLADRPGPAVVAGELPHGLAHRQVRVVAGLLEHDADPLPQLGDTRSAPGSPL